jgi:ABC-type polysaccharide/polyol phosphate transport system ATPase subunit
MTHDVAISVERLGKKYRLGHAVGRRAQATFREVIAGATVSATRALIRRSRSSHEDPEEFWALRNISFDVRHGEIVGIVGRNGAGKSTLLKIFSRITEPTEGQVRIRGRIASLLEVGTGFHPELTGRENIYLNGAILGMTYTEVRGKFDEIVAFAEVERFLDTPVKRYSSGMYVRLAFAVAAHLEPEILVIDEVLAVGDQEFQAKCLRKMDQVKHTGRTILFVSHNIAAVRALCTTAALLDAGRLVGVGSVGHVLDLYISSQKGTHQIVDLTPPNRDKPHIEQIRLLSPTIGHGECVEFELDIMSPTTGSVGLDIRIHDEQGSAIAYVSTHMVTSQIKLQAGRRTRLKLMFGPLGLAVGGYDVYFCLIKPAIEDLHDIRQPIRFEVLHADPSKNGFEFRQSYGLGAFTVPLQITTE